jgi:AcrR family transcriptional regulator
VTPNRRGRKSRELVLDAAERVMAEHGFEGATVARVVEEAGIPLSSIYHYYGSKDRVLLAVMERGAERFFADLPVSERRTGRPAQHLAMVIARVARALERHPDFLRLLIVFAAQPPAAAGGEVRAVVGRVRELGLERLRQEIVIAFGDDARSPATDRLARFGLATIDGAFVAVQTDTALTLEEILQPLAPALVAARRALIADA